MENDVKQRRAVPVKMIWFLIVAVNLLGSLVSVGAFSSAPPDRYLVNVLAGAVPQALMGLGAALCLSRGCVNLSLPGTMALSSLVFAAAAHADVPAAAAFLLAILPGAAVGAVNGAFAALRSRSIAFVTALASLLTGLFASGIALVSRSPIVLNGYVTSDRSALVLASALLLLAAVGLCFAGAAGSARLFRPFEGGSAAGGGAGRFLWHVAAGALAALAGAFQAFRLRAFTPSGDAAVTLGMTALVLLAAGILIPNMRGSYGEALFGLLAVPVCALTLAAVNTSLSMQGADPGPVYIVLSVLGLLLLIPNLLIYRRGKDRL